MRKLCCVTWHLSSRCMDSLVVRGLRGNTAQAGLLHGTWDRSYSTKARTRAPCFARQILNHFIWEALHHKLPLNRALPILRVCSSRNVSHLSYEQLQPSSCSGQNLDVSHQLPNPRANPVGPNSFKTHYNPVTPPHLHCYALGQVHRSPLQVRFHASIWQSVPSVAVSIRA